MTEHTEKVVGKGTQTPAAPQRHYTGILKNAALICFGVIFALSLGEILVRFAAPQKLYRFPKGMFVNHPTLQYALTPNFRGISETAEYETSVRINSAGLREDREYGPKPTTVYRILAIGDSFTMGVGVESESTFTNILEQRLNRPGDGNHYEIINSGVPGYNTRQELRNLQENGFRLEPDLIVLGFYIGNDITDNFHNSTTVVIDGYLRSGPPSNGILPFFIRDTLQRQSHLYNLLWPYQRRLFHANTREQETLKKQQYLSIYAKKDNQSTSAMWASTRKQLKLLAELARSNSVKLAVVIIPDQIQINTNMWTQIIMSAKETTASYDRDKPTRRLLEYCEALGIPALDLLPALTYGENTKQLYLPLDSHWTPLGNTIAAEAILEYLVREHLTPPALVR